MPQWVDDVKSAIKTRLEAALPTQIAAIDAERSVDEFGATPVPVEYWIGDKELPNTLPCGEIICTASTKQSQDESPSRWQHNITVVMTIAGTDEQMLDAQITRLMLATMLVLDGWSLYAGGVLNSDGLLKTGNITYDLVQPSDIDGRPFVRTGLIEMTTSQML